MTERRAYLSDLSDARWALIEATLTAWRQEHIDRRPTAVPAPTDLREVFNAILYVNRTGIPWKYAARLPEPSHRLRLLRCLARRGHLRPTQLRPDRTGPHQGRS
jgi:transposase